MSDDIYKKLVESIGKFGNGFAAAKDGSDVRFLKALFDEDEARIYTNLSYELETPETIAKRAGENPIEVAEILKRMNKKGLVMPGRKGEQRFYAAAPFAHGFYEHQVHHLDKKLIELFQEYSMAEKVGPPRSRSMAMLRSVPVNETVESDKTVLPHDDVMTIIDNHDRIAVATCFCSAFNKMTSDPSDRLDEVCIFFDFYADYYVENDWGRWISKEEAIEILERSKENGYVCQPTNAKNPGAVCNCNPDYCQPFQATKMQPKPAEYSGSNYYAQVVPELCDACKACLERCPIEAITIKSEDAVSEVNSDRCIGCGLCIDVCPNEARTMQEKPEEELIERPDHNPFMKSPDVYENEMD